MFDAMWVFGLVIRVLTGRGGQAGCKFMKTPKMWDGERRDGFLE